MDALIIDIDDPAPEQPIELGAPAEVMQALLAAGYVQIDLEGLARYGCRLRDDEVGDFKCLFVDDDARLLTGAYHELGRILAAGSPGKHRVYVADGCFEITAFITGDQVRMRMGEHRGPPEPELTEISMTLDEYRRLWRTIARTLAEAARR